MLLTPVFRAAAWEGPTKVGNRSTGSRMRRGLIPQQFRGDALVSTSNVDVGNYFSQRNIHFAIPPRGRPISGRLPS
jgi:hypothetical protein